MLREAVIFLGDRIISLIVFALILLLIIIILFIVQKRLKNRLKTQHKEIQVEDTFLKDIDSLRSEHDPIGNVIEKLDGYVKKFLREDLRITKNLDYTELTSYFKSKNKDKLSLFTHQMLEALYSGEDLTKETLYNLIDSFKRIVTEERLHIKENEDLPEEELEKKIISPIHSIPHFNEDQVIEAYKNLQNLFEKAYKKAVQENNLVFIRQLQDFRKNIAKKIKLFKTNKSKIQDLSQEISKGEAFIKKNDFR